MPTGYTAPVQDGKVTEFRDFAMLCARAFGALIEMRDDSIDAPIPDEFQPSDYYAKNVAKAQHEIDRLLAMADADKSVAAQKAFEDAAASWDAYEARKAQSVARYEAMLAQVKSWSPPTADHAGLKDFMTKQLSESIEFDGSPSHTPRPTLQQTDVWFSEALKDAKDDLDRATKGHADEIKRVSNRNQWLRDLRGSLASERGGGE